MRKCTKCKEGYDDSGFYGKHPHCKLCQRKAKKVYYDEVLSADPKRRRDYSKKWRKKNLLRARELARSYHERRREKILTFYSKGVPACKCCGEREKKFLSIDHIYGGGLKQSRELKYGRGGLSAWIVRAGFPSGFQILCHNCNFSKGHYGECPHNKKQI